MDYRVVYVRAEGALPCHDTGAVESEDQADCWPNSCSHCMQATAERLGVMHLLDKRFAGVAKGVGSGKILGRIHQVHNDIAFNTIHCLRSLPLS